MTIFLLGMAVLTAGGALAFALRQAPRAAGILGAGSAFAGSALALWPSVTALLTGARETFEAAWEMPFGAIRIELDPLSGLFLIPILALTALAAMYGHGYLKPRTGDTDERGQRHGQQQGPDGAGPSIFIRAIRVISGQPGTSGAAPANLFPSDF